MQRTPAAPASRKPAKLPAPPECKTLGPVSDLERHLPSDWWRTLFNALYLKTDGDVVEHPGNTRQEVDLVVGLTHLMPNDNILDLCCGQGRHSLELARRGFKNVTGVDRSRYLIRQARKRARNENLAVGFHEGDARRFRPQNRHYHCVMMMGNSFGYFEQRADDEAVLQNVARLLARQGILFLDIVDGEWMRQNYEPRSWEWIDQDHFVCRERALAKDGQRLISREVITHAEKGVIADQFYAERLYSRDEIFELLDTVGYTSVRFHGALEAESSRGQDLGMMAHRLILTAVGSSKAAVAVPGAFVKPSRVTVLLGDPSLPDSIKRNGQFNEEDLDTIKRMKTALSELEDYKFTYVDNHQNLVRSILTEPPEFVLNLCDEGFLNDAFKELHVPALLEMFDVPYTGAGPACLGFCYNKGLVDSVARSLDVPTPMESFVGADDTMATLPSTFPALIKPNFGDSSIGITQNAVVHNMEELMNYVDWLRETYGACSLLIQEFLTGPEYTVGIVGNPGLAYHVLPLLEVDYSKLDPALPKLLGYESKWLPDSPYWTDISYREAQVKGDTRRQLLDYSNVLFERLGCRDYARFDFRCDAEGTVKLLEVNPNPGWCWDGKMNLMAGFEGLRYADLLRMILHAAQERLSAPQLGRLKNP